MRGVRAARECQITPSTCPVTTASGDLQRAAADEADAIRPKVQLNAIVAEGPPSDESQAANETDPQVDDDPASPSGD